MSDNTCKLCGKDPAEGWAFINDDRYCHGDDIPSCYEMAGAPRSTTSKILADLWRDLGLGP